MEFFTGRLIKKTRKSHQCFLCNLEIPKGLPCTYQSGKYQGDFFSDYSHHECMGKWREINSENDCGEDWVDFEDMAEYYPYENLGQWKDKISNQYNLSTNNKGEKDGRENKKTTENQEGSIT